MHVCYHMHLHVCLATQAGLIYMHTSGTVQMFVGRDYIVQHIVLGLISASRMAYTSLWNHFSWFIQPLNWWDWSVSAWEVGMSWKWSWECQLSRIEPALERLCTLFCGLLATHSASIFGINYYSCLLCLIFIHNVQACLVPLYIIRNYVPSNCSTLRLMRRLSGTKHNYNYKCAVAHLVPFLIPFATYLKLAHSHVEAQVSAYTCETT